MIFILINLSLFGTRTSCNILFLYIVLCYAVVIIFLNAIIPELLSVRYGLNTRFAKTQLIVVIDQQCFSLIFQFHHTIKKFINSYIAFIVLAFLYLLYRMSCDKKNKNRVICTKRRVKNVDIITFLNLFMSYPTDPSIS